MLYIIIIIFMKDVFVSEVVVSHMIIFMLDTQLWVYDVGVHSLGS